MIRFGPFQIDPRTWTLARDGQSIDLSPRLVEILGHLATRGGAIVTKDELLERFWPGVNISDNTLTRAVADIRKMLADSAAAPTYLQTIPRQGYRFVGPNGAGESEDSPLRTADRAPEPDEGLFRDWANGSQALETIDASRLAEARRATAVEPDNWRHHFRLGSATWGEERLRASYRVIELRPDFAPARMLSAMVFVARGALARAEQEASRGTEIQRASAGTGTPIPAAGLHWLRGLIMSARGERDEALRCFEEEIAAGSDGHVYGRVFVADARMAAGFVLIGRGDAPGAVAQFTQVLTDTPRHARALLGLQASRILAKEFRASDEAMHDVHTATDELTRMGRQTEAALVEASERCVMGRVNEAVEVLDRMLTLAPVGPAGWIIPVDPMLSAVRYVPGRAGILAKLAARAS